MGDEHVRREPEPWIDTLPEVRLAETLGMSNFCVFQLEAKPPELRARCEIPDPLLADSLEILARLADGEG